MNAKADGRTPTPTKAAQALSEEIKQTMSVTNNALAAAVRQTKEAREANQRAARATVAKAKEDLARVLSSQNAIAASEPERSAQPNVESSNPKGILSAQMKMTQESLDAAQQGIEQALKAASRLVDEAMKQTAPMEKKGDSSGTSTAREQAAPALHKITRIRRTFRRRR